MTIRPTVRVHAALAELPSAIKLWYALRLLDEHGNGRVVTTIDALAELMELSVPTIKRYFRQGKKLGLYRDILKPRGQETITVYLSSLSEVCKRHNIENWGACTDIYASELKNIRLITTQATAQKVQQQSRHLARKQAASSSTRTGRNQKQQPGKVLRRTDRFVYVSNDYASFGASQKTIGQRIARNERTVRRRLSNSVRQAKGLPTLDRKQTIKQVGTIKGGSGFKELLNLGVSGIFGKKNNAGDIDIWGYLPNVYSEDLKLYSQRRVRANHAAVMNIDKIGEGEPDAFNPLALRFMQDEADPI